MKKILFFCFFSFILLNYIFSNNLILYPNEIIADSYLLEDGQHIYHPYNLYDNNPTTVYSESLDGDGKGNKIEFLFEDIVNIKQIVFFNGYQTDDLGYKDNNRVKEVYISSYIDDKINNKIELLIQDKKEEQKIEITDTLKGNKIVIEILSVYKGDKYNDTCISEITFFGNSTNNNIHQKKEYPIDVVNIKKIFNNLNNKHFESLEGPGARFNISFKNNIIVFIFEIAGGYRNVFAAKYSIHDDELYLYPLYSYENVFEMTNIKGKNDYSIVKKNHSINKNEIVVIKILNLANKTIKLYFKNKNEYFNAIFNDFYKPPFFNKEEVQEIAKTDNVIKKLYYNLENNIVDFNK